MQSLTQRTDTLFLRIDDRLIHGQVVESWLPFLKSEAVLIVSDSVAADDVQQALMSIAVPEQIGLHFAPAASAAKAAQELSKDKRLLVLAPGPKEALALLQGGVSVRAVNVGGLHHSAGKVQLGKAIFLSDEDKQALREILALGVALEGRAVPTERAADIAELLR